MTQQKTQSKTKKKKWWRRTRNNKEICSWKKWIVSYTFTIWILCGEGMWHISHFFWESLALGPGLWPRRWDGLIYLNQLGPIPGDGIRVRFPKHMGCLGERWIPKWNEWMKISALLGGGKERWMLRRQLKNVYCIFHWVQWAKLWLFLEAQQCRQMLAEVIPISWERNNSFCGGFGLFFGSQHWLPTPSSMPFGTA